MVKSSATRVIFLVIGILLILQTNFLQGEVVKGELCKGITCKPKPTAGVCIARDSTTLSATSVYGPQRVCCSVYACTHENKTTTLHFGMTGMTIIKKTAVPKNETAAEKAKKLKEATNATCSAITCLTGQPSPSCRKSTPSSIKTLMQVQEDCCPLWTCSFASNGTMYFVHTGMRLTTKFWTVEGYKEDDSILPVTEAPVIIEENTNSTNTTTSNTTTILEDTDLVLDKTWGTKVSSLDLTASSTCPRVNCVPQQPDLKCTVEKKPINILHLKLLGLDSDCCPIYKCWGKLKVYLVYFGLHTVEVVEAKVNEIPTENPVLSTRPPTSVRPATTSSPEKKKTSLTTVTPSKLGIKVLTTVIPSKLDFTTVKSNLNKGTTPISTILKSNGTSKPRTSNYTTTKNPIDANKPENNSVTVAPVNRSTIKPITSNKTSSERPFAPTTIPKPNASGHTINGGKNAGTSSPIKKPSATTHSGTMDAGEGAEPDLDPAGINIVDPVSVVDGDIPDTDSGPVVVNSTVDKPQCINMKCFPAPSKEKCVIAPITDCQLITLLGSALDCCPSYKCSFDTGDAIQFGITDGVSESVISNPLPDAENTPKVCGEADTTASDTSIKPESDNDDSKSSLKPFLIFEVNEEPTIITTTKQVRYVKSCSGTVCFPPTGVNIKKCRKLPKETIPKQMKAFGITTACCSVWTCSKANNIVTTHYGVSHHPVASITFEYKGSDTTKLPQSLSLKDSEPPQESTLCPGVLCSPPLKHSECTIASPTALKAIKGSLRKAKKCCPIWTCKRKDGSSLTMYGRTAPSVYSKKNMQSILQGQSFTTAAEEDSSKVFSFENRKRQKINKPKHKKSKKTTATTPPTFIFVDEPKFSVVELPADDQIEPPPKSNSNSMPHNDPMMAQVMEMQNQQMKMNQEQMQSMQQNNIDNINRMQQGMEMGMGTHQGMGMSQSMGSHQEIGMGQRMEMNGMVMEMNMPGPGDETMPTQNLQMSMTQFR